MYELFALSSFIKSFTSFQIFSWSTAEISFLSGEPASADVHANDELFFVSWNSDRLKNLKDENPSFWMKLQHALTEDLIKKVKPKAKLSSQLEK